MIPDRGHRPGATEGLVDRAVDELQELGGELDVPDAARAPLHLAVRQPPLADLVLDKQRANLGMARYQLTQIEKDLVV